MGSAREWPRDLTPAEAALAGTMGATRPQRAPCAGMLGLLAVEGTGNREQRTQSVASPSGSWGLGLRWCTTGRHTPRRHRRRPLATGHWPLATTPCGHHRRHAAASSDFWPPRGQYWRHAAASSDFWPPRGHYRRHAAASSDFWPPRGQYWRHAAASSDFWPRGGMPACRHAATTGGMRACSDFRPSREQGTANSEHRAWRALRARGGWACAGAPPVATPHGATGAASPLATGHWPLATTP